MEKQNNRSRIVALCVHFQTNTYAILRLIYVSTLTFEPSDIIKT